MERCRVELKGGIARLGEDKRGIEEKDVTLTLLWQEYLQEHPEGLQYVDSLALPPKKLLYASLVR